MATLTMFGLIVYGHAEAESLAAQLEDAIMDEPARGEAVRHAAAKRPVWVTLLPLTPVKSLAEFRAAWRILPLIEGDLKAYSAELEIRTPDNEKRVARVPDIIKLHNRKVFQVQITVTR